jgi:hypothetical protein
LAVRSACCFAYGGLRVLIALTPSDLPRLNDIGIDGFVLLFALGEGFMKPFLDAIQRVLEIGRPEELEYSLRLARTPASRMVKDNS